MFKRDILNVTFLVRNLLRGVLFGIPIGITFVDRIGSVAKVDGVSMQPTLNPDTWMNDYVFLNHWIIHTEGIRRGEIVAVKSPKRPSETLIKRVVGLPGDIICTHGNCADVLQIPEGHCWIEGDHTGYSLDSTTFGPVSLGLITAKATCIQEINCTKFSTYTMRAVSFVKRLQWDLPGTVCRHGLTIGDIDNDGDNELVVGTTEGELYIFKGSELWHKIPGLGLITSVAVGDIFNYGRNALVVICGDGWAHIFYSPRSVNPSTTNTAFSQQPTKEPSDQDNNKDQTDGGSEANELTGKMECVHVQRIPTNTKVVLIEDVDKDGANEMILGLTDRVVRSYRWSSNLELGRGKLIGLNKWECASQIGTVTLQHTADGTPTLLVAQPGGTFMRIKCNPKECYLEDEAHQTDHETAASCVDYQTLGISRMRNQNISTEIIGDLECTSVENKTTFNESSSKENVSSDIRPGDSFMFKTTACNNEMDKVTEKTDPTNVDQVDGNVFGGNLILGDYDEQPEKDSMLPTYKDFSQNNNNNDNSHNCNSSNSSNSIISRGNDESRTRRNVEQGSPQGKPYALATLDGTIMLVKDEVISWSMQVDHLIFALCRLDVTGDGSDEIVACSWDGQTYILDQQRNSVRFQFEEPVRAFCTGNYNVSPGVSTPSLVYNTFNNKIFLYYDVTLPSMVIKPLNPLEELDPEEKNTFDDLLGCCNATERSQKMQQMTEWLLYGTS